MKQQKPPCLSIYPWLKENLGKNCLGVLTGTDQKALKAAMQILALYAYDSGDHNHSVIDAFAIVVRRMQPSARHLAYHAIAHVMDWSDRSLIWRAAGLGECPCPRQLCGHEPGGRSRRMTLGDIEETVEVLGRASAALAKHGGERQESET